MRAVCLFNTRRAASAARTAGNRARGFRQDPGKLPSTLLRESERPLSFLPLPLRFCPLFPLPAWPAAARAGAGRSAAFPEGARGIAECAVDGSFGGTRQARFGGLLKPVKGAGRARRTWSRDRASGHGPGVPALLLAPGRWRRRSARPCPPRFRPAALLVSREATLRMPPPHRASPLWAPSLLTHWAPSLHSRSFTGPRPPAGHPQSESGSERGVRLRRRPRPRRYGRGTTPTGTSRSSSPPTPPTPPSTRAPSSPSTCCAPPPRAAAAAAGWSGRPGARWTPSCGTRPLPPPPAPRTRPWSCWWRRGAAAWRRRWWAGRAGTRRPRWCCP